MHLNSLKHARMAFETARPIAPAGPAAAVQRAEDLQERWDLGSGRLGNALMQAVSGHASAKTTLVAMCRHHQAVGLPGPTGKEMFELLKQKYDIKDIISLNDAKMALMQLKAGVDEDSEDFMIRFDHAVAEVVRLGGHLSDEDKFGSLQQCFNGVPGFKSLAVSLLTTVGLTLQGAVTLVKQYTRKVNAARGGQKRPRSDSQSAVMVTTDTKSAASVEGRAGVTPKRNRVEPRCYKCGKLGHFRADCRATSQAVTCGYCKRPNHQEKDCRKKAKDQKRKQSRGQSGATAVQRSEPSSDGLSRFVFQKPEVSVIMELQSDLAEDERPHVNKIFIDSGASDDLLIVCNPSWLRHFRPFMKQLGTANKDMDGLLVTGRGRIGGLKAFYTPDVRKNVIAVRPLAARGLTVCLGDEPRLIDTDSGAHFLTLTYAQGCMPYMSLQDLEKIAAMPLKPPAPGSLSKTRGLPYCMMAVFGNASEDDSDLEPVWKCPRREGKEVVELFSDESEDELS